MPLSPADVYVGQRLRTRRRELGLTQRAIAEALSVSPRTIRLYESGTRRIPPKRIDLLAQILKVRVAYFFSQAPDESPHD